MSTVSQFFGGTGGGGQAADVPVEFFIVGGGGGGGASAATANAAGGGGGGCITYGSSAISSGFTYPVIIGTGGAGGATGGPDGAYQGENGTPSQFAIWIANEGGGGGCGINAAAGLANLGVAAICYPREASNKGGTGLFRIGQTQVTSVQRQSLPVNYRLYNKSTQWYNGTNTIYEAARGFGDEAGTVLYAGGGIGSTTDPMPWDWHTGFSEYDDYAPRIRSEAVAPGTSNGANMGSEQRYAGFGAGANHYNVINTTDEIQGGLLTFIYHKSPDSTYSQVYCGNGGNGGSNTNSINDLLAGQFTDPQRMADLYLYPGITGPTGNGGSAIADAGNGPASTGCGGGGAGYGGVDGRAGGNGANGIVHIAYPDSFPAAVTTGNPEINLLARPGFRIYAFTSSGSFRIP